MDGKCKTCKHWGMEFGNCEHPWVGGPARHEIDGAQDGEGYSGIYTGPEFGCVHYESENGESHDGCEMQLRVMQQSGGGWIQAHAEPGWYMNTGCRAIVRATAIGSDWLGTWWKPWTWRRGLDVTVRFKIVED
jgi:hypothetical protein